jgi:hypothetical protein
MSTIYDMAGTSCDSFTINGKCTILQGDNAPNKYQGQNGDVYFQTDGSIYSKRTNNWISLTASSMPIASGGTNKFLYSDGSGYTFTDFTIDYLTDNLTDISNKADDSTVVHLEADETIIGVKTFTASIPVKYISTTMDITTIPSNNQYQYTDFRDKNNERIGVVGSMVSTSGYYGTYLQSGNTGTLAIYTNGSDSYAVAPTPSSATDSSNKVATTSWINNINNNLVHKTDTEIISGSKTFAEDVNIGSTVLRSSGGLELVPDTGSSQGGYIDFHYAGTTGDYTSRIIESGNGALTLSAKNVYAPTPSSSDSSTRVATTAFVNSIVSSSVSNIGGVYLTGDKLGSLSNSTSTYTAPNNCYALCRTVRSSSGNGTVNVYINGNFIVEMSSNDWNNELVGFYIAKGDTFTFNSPSGLTSYDAYFFATKN